MKNDHFLIKLPMSLPVALIVRTETLLPGFFQAQVRSPVRSTFRESAFCMRQLPQSSHRL
jgi:hypothetical protein